jgi:alpha-glucosidase
MKEAPTQTPLWWKSGVIYQLYPRSFQDANGDGVGDLRGIQQRLDYLQWLGVKAVWISPIYPSPMADFGYDISDYTNIHPLFGTLADFDALLADVHARGLKLILDLVPNHTSDKHPWFLESRSSKDNPKRNWYLWRDAKEDGSVPNNWLAAFGGPAWEWDDATQQYYYHAFLKEQPDLNWRNPEVQEEMLKVMQFWLDRGVDGFRVDVMWHMIKDGQWRDNPPNPDYKPHMGTYDQLLPVYSTDQPEVHDLVRRMRLLLDRYTERVMIGEIYLPIHKLVTYYGVDNTGAHLPFNFQLITLPWNAGTVAGAINEYEGALPLEGWPNWVLSNHDQPRIASRIGSDQARVAAMLLLTLRGTPTLYYGDEIGMRDVPIPWNQIQDPQGLNMPDKNLSRDPARTPMQWDTMVHAGFSAVRPWLPLERHAGQRNVALQRNDPGSTLSLYRRLLQLRNAEQAFTMGNYTPVYADHQLISYIREEIGGKRFLIVLNLTHRTALFRAGERGLKGTVVLSTVVGADDRDLEALMPLEGDEGIVVKLDS